MNAEEDTCVFTSECNSLGVCCQNPTTYAGYEQLQQMSPEGTCCVYAGDCRSGICIGQVCREPEDALRAKEDNNRKSYYIVGICAVFMGIAGTATMCLMRCCNDNRHSVEMKIANSNSEHDEEAENDLPRQESIGFQIEMNVKVGNKLARAKTTKQPNISPQIIIETPVTPIKRKDYSRARTVKQTTKKKVSAEEDFNLDDIEREICSAERHRGESAMTAAKECEDTNRAEAVNEEFLESCAAIGTLNKKITRTRSTRSRTNRNTNAEATTPLTEINQ